MTNNNIVIIKETETNAFANPAKANNGGGYSQPLIEGMYLNHSFTFHDTSCGDFGRRYDFEIDGFKYHYDGTGRDAYESSYIPQEYSEAIKAIGEELGFRFFTEEELRED